MSPPYRGALTNFWNLYVHDKRDKNILKHQSYCFFLHQRLRYIFSPNSMQIRYFSLFEHRMKLLCRHLFYNMLFTPFWAHPRIRYSRHCLPFCPGNLNQNSIGLYGNKQITCAFKQMWYIVSKVQVLIFNTGMLNKRPLRWDIKLSLRG